MSTSSDPCSSSSSPDEYPLLTSSELSRLLLDQEMNFAVATAFSSFQLFFFDSICFFLTTSNESDKTSFNINKNGNPFSIYSVTPHCFKISSHLSSWIFGFDNDRYPQSTLLPLSKRLLSTLLFLNRWLNDSPLSFKNEATVLTLFFRFTLLHMKNRECVTTPSMSTDC